MLELTERQKQILTAIIREYMESAQEIGSHFLIDKYNMRVSSATVRNEMMRLMELGLLNKSHVSSGRIPTDQALRLYFKEMSEPEPLDSLAEVEIRQEVFRDRFDKDKLIRAILEILNEASDSASFMVVDSSVRYYGLSNLIRFHEMQKLEVLKRILDLLEDEEFLEQLLSRYSGEEISILIGNETGVDDLENCAMAFCEANLWGDKVCYGVIGSRRMDFPHVLLVMKKLKESIDESLRGWR